MSNGPKIGTFELHLWTSADFTRKGWGKKVRALGGEFRAARGHDDTRFVFVPDSEAGRKLIGELLSRFSHGFSTTVIVRFDGSRKLGDSSAPVCVHYVKKTTDPHAAIGVVVACFYRAYQRVMAKRFRAQSRAWFRRTSS